MLMKIPKVAVCAALGVCAVAYGDKYEFHAIGWLGGEGGYYVSNAYAVSADGVAAGYSSADRVDGRLPTQAVTWTRNGGIAGLGYLPDGYKFSTAQGVALGGEVVCGVAYVNSTTPGAFRWTSAEGMTDLGHLPGGSGAGAYAVTGDGKTIVGGSTSTDGYEAYRWTADGGMVGLGELPGGRVFSVAYGVSNDAHVLSGWSESAAGIRAVRWVDGDIEDLGDLPGGENLSFANDVSGNGQVVVGGSSSSRASREAMIWTEDGGMKGLGDLAGGESVSIAHGTNWDGSVVVGEASVSGGRVAMIWTPERGMRSLKTVLTNEYGLDLRGWTLTGANAISPDGNIIAGVGEDPNGFGQGWVAFLPEPGTAVMLMLVACAMRRVSR